MANALGNLQVAGGMGVGSYAAPTTSGQAVFSGNVGIGTTSPGTNKLQITGGTTSLGGATTITTGGLTVSAGGASITGGLNNNSGGITNAGALSGATTIGLTGAISGGTTANFSSTVTAPTFSGALSGNASTATALAASGSTCAAGSFPLGVDASGNVKSCTTVSSLAPTLTGGGASGTWGINVTGNAGSASSVAWGNVSGKPFNWSGQSGQPSWLWGSNDGSNYYVWNPSNFNVNSVDGYTFNQCLTTSCSPQFTSVVGTTNVDAGYFAVYASGNPPTRTNYITMADRVDIGELVVNYGTNGTIYKVNVTSLSDKRLKSNITSLTDVLPKVMQLKPSEYDFHDPRVKGSVRREIGLIAQDVQRLFPEIVEKTEGGPGYLALQYERLVPIAIAAIQEQQSEIATISTQLAPITLTNTGNLKIINENGNYRLVNKDNSPVTHIAAFAELAVAKLKGGLIEAQKVVIDGVDVMQKLNDQQQQIDLLKKEIEGLKK